MSGVVGRIALAEARHTLTGLPKWLYIGIGIIAAVLLLLWWDASRIKAAEKRGSDAAYAAIEKQARAIEQRANRITAGTSTLLRNLNDEENSRISAGFDALRLSGPGKAVCTGVAGVPAATGQHEPTSGRPDGAVDRVPYPEWSQLIAMPFPDLLKRAEQCDLNRAEVLTWRDWWTQQNANWKKLQSEGTQP